VPVVCGEAVGRDGGASGWRRAWGGGTRPVGLCHPQNAPAVLPAPPGVARRTRPFGCQVRSSV